jgi:hypothetical protein
MHIFFSTVYFHYDMTAFYKSIKIVYKEESGIEVVTKEH